MVKGETNESCNKNTVTNNYTSNLINEEIIMNIISKRDIDGDTGLMLLLIHHHHDIALQIIKHRLSLPYLNTQNNFGQSVLHIAVYLQQEDLIRALINKGARVDLIDYRGRNIFHYCAELGDIHILQVILKTLAKKVKNIFHVLNTTDYDGDTPFTLATKAGNQSFCICLLNAGIDVNKINPKTGNTVLHEAVLSSDIDLVIFLLKRIKVDASIPNYAGSTPNMIAKINGDFETLKYLT